MRRGRWPAFASTARWRCTLFANAAIAGALVWALADADTLPAPRQSRAQVQAVLKATGLDTQMKTFSLWDEFATGKRGRQ